MNEIPHEFICPITFEIMEDPIICSDGYTYERNVILNLTNSISPITRQPIDKNNLISNRNLKDAIERYKMSQNKKISIMSRLEIFENEQKLKKEESKNKIKRELIEKRKRDEEILKKKQKEQQQTIKFNRILNMLNSQNNSLFNYGYTMEYNSSMNQFVNVTYRYEELGRKKYIITIEMLRSIKNENKEILEQKYNKIVDDYIWIKKYVNSEASNPLIEFVFDKFIPEIDKLLEKDLKLIEENKKWLQEFVGAKTSHMMNNINGIKNIINNLLNKVNLITKIKNNLKSKEYYIVNYEEFCKDFEINNFSVNFSIHMSQTGENWNIFNYWIENKHIKFNNLINNIFNIFNFNSHSLNKKYVYNSSDNNSNELDNLRNNIKNMNGENLIVIYKNVIESKTHRNYRSEQYHNRSDIISDYIPEYFYPLMELTKNIIELIEFLKDEI
jgi:hypothetical protein